LIELSVWDRFHYVDGWSVHSSFHELEGAAFLSDQRIITVSGGDTLLFFLIYGAV